MFLYQKGNFESMRKDASDFAKDRYFNGYSDNRSVQENFDLNLGLGRFIDVSMLRNTECTDTCINMLGAVSRYFLKNRTANVIYAEP